MILYLMEKSLKGGRESVIYFTAWRFNVINWLYLNHITRVSSITCLAVFIFGSLCARANSASDGLVIPARTAYAVSAVVMAAKEHDSWP